MLITRIVYPRLTDGKMKHIAFMLDPDEYVSTRRCPTEVDEVIIYLRRILTHCPNLASIS